MPKPIPPVTDVPGPTPFGVCCSLSRPICMRISFSHRGLMMLFQLITPKSVVTMSVPLADSATVMTACV